MIVVAVQPTRLALGSLSRVSLPTRPPTAPQQQPEEARLAGLLLKEAGISRLEAVYTSCLKRAIKTAWL